MKILAFSAGVLLPVGIAYLLGGGLSDDQDAPQEAAPVAALAPSVQTTDPGDVIQTALPQPGTLSQSDTPTIAPQTTEAATPVPKLSPDAPPKPLALYPIDLEGAQKAWNDWRLKYNVKASSMALGAAGDILASTGDGRSPDAPYPLASLSKAITAMCLNHVLADTPYTWGTRIAELAPLLTQMNMAPHEGAQALSLSDLATHTSGFPKNIDGNETAGEGRNLFTQQHFAREALTNPARQTATRQHEYSNVNYAVLGQIITALTGTAYSDACTARVLQPVGADTAVVGGRMWATAGFGGWSASAEDYARFVMFWLGPDTPWVRKPDVFAFDQKSGAGLGVYHTMARNSFTLHHTGLWRNKRHPEREHGTMFIISETGATFVANWQGHLQPKIYAELRKAITPHLR